MGFGKALGIGLAVFVGANFGMTILYQLLVEGQITLFSNLTDIGVLMGALFGAIVTPPTFSFLYVFASQPLADMFLGAGAPPGTFPSNLQTMMFYGGLFLYIIPCVAAALVSGLFAGSKGKAFGAWFLICAIAGVILILMPFIGFSVDIGPLTYFISSLDLTGMMGLEAMMGMFAMFVIIFSIILNGLFYGVFAILTSREEF